jgi:hypothetical protein
VICHGGPTGSTSTALNLTIQFWTSRGFAVLDVNYRGSTGYGRAYRKALDGQWGIVDVEDCLAGARMLAAQGLVDGKRMAIRGSSAGGFTVLCALTFHDVFAAGASYYGVSDLEALAQDTHKFESHYLESLIGPYPQRRDIYRARSPIHAADRLSCPGDLLSGPARSRGAARPGREHGAALKQPRPNRTARDLSRRAARLPAQGNHRPRSARRARVLPRGLWNQRWGKLAASPDPVRLPGACVRARSLP